MTSNIVILVMTSLALIMGVGGCIQNKHIEVMDFVALAYFFLVFANSAYLLFHV